MWSGSSGWPSVMRGDVRVWLASVNQLQEPLLPFLGTGFAFSISHPHDQMDVPRLSVS